MAVTGTVVAGAWARGRFTRPGQWARAGARPLATLALGFEASRRKGNGAGCEKRAGPESAEVRFSK